MMTKKKMDVIVIGGGASGMMAAIAAAREGCRVLILEHMDEPGRKILATGNGRCNFTNAAQGCECYRGTTPAFVLPALKKFGWKDAVDFFEELGVWARQREGYYYPRSMQASAIRQGLLSELKRRKVQVECGIGIRNIKKERTGFVIEAKNGDYYGSACILAAGGKASPKSGSDGSGYIYAEKLGHSCIQPLPALVPLLTDAKWNRITAGVRGEARITLYVRGKTAASDSGEVQFTDYGLSGIPVFQVSRYASRALYEGEDVRVQLDLMADVEEEALFQRLISCANAHPFTSWKELLSGMINSKLSEALCGLVKGAGELPGEMTKEGKRKTALELSRLMKRLTCSVTGTKTFQQAQVTAGGVDTAQIDSSTMGSKLVNGLYFAGEIMDIDGICGGYNLHWAWASGQRAGKSAAEYVKKG